MSTFPRIFLIPNRLEPGELHELEDEAPNLTYDIQEAEVVVGRFTSSKRALMELRRREVHTAPLVTPESSQIKPDDENQEPDQKRRRLNDMGSRADSIDQRVDGLAVRTVKMVGVAWLVDSLEKGEPIPLGDYLVYEGRVLPGDSPVPAQEKLSKGSDVLTHATADDSGSYRKPTIPHHGGKPSTGISFGGGTNHRGVRQPSTTVHPHHAPPTLVHETTSDHENAANFPPIPAFLKTTYSCQRPTPVNPPNESFVEQLKKIRTTRKLVGDEVGVRAYSTSIAALAAYPYQLTAPAEVARLPGCGSKIAQLYLEWKETGRVSEVEQARDDPKLSVLGKFYDIWGVGDTTARSFYSKGWRDLDDVVEYGWETLTRVQQIGVKYYDEFVEKIPRAEVERIGNTILRHARVIDPGYQLTIVGGYRRGKQSSGDVDVVISHPNETATSHFVEKIVVSLEKTGHITHTLSLSSHNSERGQAPVSWKGNTRAGSGFDTLDKALVVWQEPRRASQDDEEEGAWPHRRVDIIISPWKTVGCAMLGWSGGTTFQRDMRRYCKNVKGLKFDSSGIRSRKDGSWVDLEGDDGEGGGAASDMVTAEKRVFEGLGLDWRPPEERCTG